MVIEEGLTVGEVAFRPSITRSTLDYRVKKAREGKLSGNSYNKQNL